MPLIIDLPDAEADQVRAAAQASGEDMRSFAHSAILRAANALQQHIQSSDRTAADDFAVLLKEAFALEAEEPLAHHTHEEKAFGDIVLEKYRRRGFNV